MSQLPDLREIYRAPTVKPIETYSAPAVVSNSHGQPYSAPTAPNAYDIVTNDDNLEVVYNTGMPSDYLNLKFVTYYITYTRHLLSFTADANLQSP